MPKKLFIWSAFGLVVATALGFSTDLVYGEIEIVGVQGPKSAGPALTGGVPGRSVSLHVQCWQNGVKIIDEVDLDGVRLRNLIEGGGVGLQGPDWKYGAVNIIPVNDASTCLIKPMR